MRVFKMRTTYHWLLILFTIYLAGCVAAVPGGDNGGNGGNGGNGPGNPPGPTVVVREFPITHGEDHGWAEVRIPSGEVKMAISPAATWFGGSRNDYDSDAFFRWRNVDIPRGATILEAKMIVWHRPGEGVNVAPIQVDIRGFAANNMSRLQDIPDLTTAARTEAKVLWSINEAWSATETTPHETPDLREVIQEIVDRPGWQAGNALGIAFDSKAYRNADRYHRELCVLNSGWQNCLGSSSPVLYVRFTQ